MGRRTLVMGASIAGLVLVLALLLFPLVVVKVGDHSQSARAIEGGTGPFLLLFAWMAFGFSALTLLGKADYIGIGEEKACMLSLLGFKLAGFFFLAHLIAGTGSKNAGWGLGFWLGFLASIAGAFIVYLTFNPALAKRLSEAARDLREGSSEGNATTPSEPSRPEAGTDERSNP